MYTVYDIETSGTSRDSEIYEFAAIRLSDDMKVIGTYNYFFYKKEWGETQEAHIHGLTKEILEPYAPDFYKNLAAMYAMMYDATVVGKNNLGFDNYVIKRFIDRNIKDLDEKATGIRKFKLGGSIDVQQYMARHYRDYMSRIGTPVSSQSKGTLEQYMSVCGFTEADLVGFAKAIGIDTTSPRFKAHGAMYDVVMTYATFVWLINHNTMFKLI